MSEVTVATLLRQQGQSQQAAEGLMRWLSQHPKDDQAWAILADCMLDLGDPAKAKEKLGWTPKITLAELVKEMVLSDYTAAKRDSLVKSAGFQAYDYHE